MSWLTQLFNRNNTKNKALHEFTDEDRVLSAEKRRMAALTRKQNSLMEAELQHLQEMQQQRMLKEKIDNYKEYLYGEDDDDDDDDSPDSIEEMAKGALAALIQKSQEKKPQQATEIKPIPLSDEQIQNFLRSIPSKYLKIAKRMEDEELKTAIMSYMPHLDATSIQKAMVAIRGS